MVWPEGEVPIHRLVLNVQSFVGQRADEVGTLGVLEHYALECRPGKFVAGEGIHELNSEKSLGLKPRLQRVRKYAFASKPLLDGDADSVRRIVVAPPDTRKCNPNLSSPLVLGFPLGRIWLENVCIFVFLAEDFAGTSMSTSFVCSFCAQ